MYIYINFNYIAFYIKVFDCGAKICSPRRNLYIFLFLSMSSLPHLSPFSVSLPVITFFPDIIIFACAPLKMEPAVFILTFSPCVVQINTCHLDPLFLLRVSLIFPMSREEHSCVSIAYAGRREDLSLSLS